MSTDIFQECFAAWYHYMKFLLGELYDDAVKLEEYNRLSIMTVLPLKVADMLEGVESIGIRINWLA